MVRSRVAVVAVLLLLGSVLPAAARARQQQSESTADTVRSTHDTPASGLTAQSHGGRGEDANAAVQQSDQADGITLPQGERFRLALRVLGGYGFDGAQGLLGLEKQGRIGYVIVGLFGKLDEHFGYLVEVNPVDENEPLPACGEQSFFFPNTPQAFGPNVQCENDGRVWACPDLGMSRSLLISARADGSFEHQ